jgi:hypothetical protein
MTGGQAAEPALPLVPVAVPEVPDEPVEEEPLAEEADSDFVPESLFGESDLAAGVLAPEPERESVR